MFKKIKQQLQEFGDFIDWLLRIGAVVAIISPIIVALRKWVELDNTDWWILGVGLFGLLLILLSIILRYAKNRSTKCIPDLLIRMDEKMKCLIGTAIPSVEKATQFFTDAGELWDIDIQRIQTAYTSKNTADLKLMVKEWENRPSPFPQSPQPFTIISTFMQSLRGLMITDEIGTETIKDVEYKKLERRLKILQGRLKDSRSVRNLDRYLMWWEGSNHFWLLKHYSLNNPIFPLMAPAKVKAAMPQLEYLLQIALNEYHGYVRDSIYGKSEGKEEWKPIT
jgi:hypothetical protein